MKIVRLGNRYVDLHVPMECARASPAALELFFDLMKQWDVGDPHARILLGRVSIDGLTQMRTAPHAHVLEPSQLKRIAFMLGIGRELNLAYGPAVAAEWVHLPNSHGMFCQVTPLNFMLLGGTQAMKNIKRLLAGRRESAAQSVPEASERPPG